MRPSVVAIQLRKKLFVIQREIRLVFQQSYPRNAGLPRCKLLFPIRVHTALIPLFGGNAGLGLSSLKAKLCQFRKCLGRCRQTAERLAPYPSVVWYQIEKLMLQLLILHLRVGRSLSMAHSLAAGMAQTFLYFELPPQSVNVPVLW